MRLFDTHAHYNDERFDGERDKIIAEVINNGVEYILNAGTDIETSQISIDLADTYPQFYASVGVHPHEASKITGLTGERYVLD